MPEGKKKLARKIRIGYLILPLSYLVCTCIETKPRKISGIPYQSIYTILALTDYPNAYNTSVPKLEYIKNILLYTAFKDTTNFTQLQSNLL